MCTDVLYVGQLTYRFFCFLEVAGGEVLRFYLYCPPDPVEQVRG